jgi:hypothetical protein
MKHYPIISKGSSQDYKFKRPKKHVVTTMTRRLREIFLVKCQKQAFSINKRQAKVYC